MKGEKRFAVLLLAAILVLQLAMHASLAKSIFFNDEGHFLAFTWLTTKGLVIYRDFFDNHPPLIELVAAVPVALLGANIVVARSLSALAQIATTAVVFLFARKLYGDKAAVAAALFYAGFEILFFGFWFVIEPFLALSLAVSAFSLAEWDEKGGWRSLALCGVVAGLSLLLKPQAVVFAAAAAFLVWRRSGMKEAAKLAAWAALPVAAVAAYFAANGALYEFVYYSAFASLLGSQGFAKLWLTPYEVAVLALAMAAAAAFAVLAARKGMKRAELITCAWFATALLFAFPRLDLFHFIPALAALAVMFGRAIGEHMGKRRQSARSPLPLAFLFVAIVFFAAFITSFAFGDTTAADRAIGAYFAARVPPDRTMVAYTFKPQIYVYADRLPASYYISLPQWFIDEKAEARIIADLESNRPEYAYLADAEFDRGETMADFAPRIYAYLRGHYETVQYFPDGSEALRRKAG